MKQKRRIRDKMSIDARSENNRRQSAIIGVNSTAAAAAAAAAAGALRIASSYRFSAYPSHALSSGY